MDLTEILTMALKEGNIVSIVAIGVLFVFQQIWSKKSDTSYKDIIARLDNLAKFDENISNRFNDCEKTIDSIKVIVDVHDKDINNIKNTIQEMKN